MTPSIIKELDHQTINQIAAGEIIERPASVVKECIENSIDANADTITVHIEDGGQTLIRITDNGHGMTSEDLQKAHRRHFTSKITTLSDIYGINSFGFRGEALAAICHAGRVDITSKTPEGDAHKITIQNGTASDVEHASHPTGTTLRIHHLFESLPVRLKFLKKPATEFAYIYDLVCHFALIHPTINFKLYHQQQDMLNTQSIQSLEQLIVLLYGKKTHRKLCPVDFELDMIRIKGMISDPTLTFSNRSKQIFAINGRIIKNPTISKAIETVFIDYIPARRFPLVVLAIDIQSPELDINVHPQKLDFKFSQMGLLFNSICQAIKGAIKATRDQFNPTVLAPKPTLESTPTPAVTPPPANTIPSAPPTRSLAPDTPPKTDPKIVKKVTLTAPLPLKPVTSVQPSQPPHVPPPTQVSPAGPRPDVTIKPTIASSDYMQIANTYILLKSESGFLMIDQHAVHERVLYERFKDQARHDTDQQRLLIPEVIEASATQWAAYETHQHTFRSLLFELEPFGKQDLMVRAIPIAFVGSNIQTLILDLLDHFVDIPDSNPDMMNAQKETLQMRACKAAIKAGQTLSDLEIRQLCYDLLQSPNNYTCPHGRPLFIDYTTADLEKMFLRT